MTQVAATATAVQQPQRRGVRLTFGALMLVLLLAALDQTIVATALPTIVADLGSVSSLSWVVTAYLLASTVSGPLYGKLGDLYGRKMVLQTAIVIFLIGSVLCGTSQSMSELIAFRALQGLGGGGLLVVTIAAVGDIIAPRDRGRYQGYFGAVFGLATVIGPLLGGFFVDNLSWRWIFYVNLPIGLLALGVIATAFQARANRVSHRIDYLGAVLLAGGLAAVVLFTSLGGTTYPWGSPPTIALIVAGIVLLVAFVFTETRADEPILPLEILRNRVFRVTSAVGFIIGVALFGAITYLPLYLQNVKGRSPTISGLLLTPLVGGMLVTSITSGNLISRFGRYRPFPIIGTALMAIGLALLARLHVGTPVPTTALDMLVVGLGLGSVMQVLVLAAQNAVDYRFLGVVSAGSTLFRQIGGSIGVSAFGAIFANQLARNLAGKIPPGVGTPTSADPAAVKRLPPAIHSVYVDAVTAALRPIFLVAAVAALVAFALAWLLPELRLRATARAEGMGEGFASPRDDDALREIERALSVLAGRQERWDLYQRLADRAGIDLSPPELWMLARLGERSPASEPRLLQQPPVDGDRVVAALRELRDRGMVEDQAGLVTLTASGGERYEGLVQARCDNLRELLDGWSPDEHPRLRRAIDDLGRDLVSAIPTPRPARAA